MQVSPTILQTPDAVGRRAAALIADGIVAATAQGLPFVLGCPSGRSAASTYRALAAEVACRQLDLSRFVIVLMDEYVVRDENGFHPVLSHLPHSCIGFGEREIRLQLSRAAPPGHGIPLANLWYPNVEDPAEYDARLNAIGGIDVFVLATGASDGHIALNPRGAEMDSTTRIVKLEESTRRDNLSTFPTFASLDEVPHYGVTVGIDTIRAQSKSVIMLALGIQKRHAVRRIQSANRYDPNWPSTILAECNSPTFLIDQAASELLETSF